MTTSASIAAACPALLDTLGDRRFAGGANRRRASTAAFYEQHAERYAASTLAVDNVARIARFAASLPSNGRVLDVGCGSGRDLLGLQAAGLAPGGLDLSPRMVAIAERVSGMPVHLGDVRRPGLPAASFDGVWAMASLLHLERDDIGTALRALGRLLVPGGLLYATVKSGSGRARDDEGRWFTLHESRSWRGHLRNAGFLVESVMTEPPSAEMGPAAATGWISSFSRKPR